VSDVAVTPEFVAAVSDWTGVPAPILSGDSAAAIWESAKLAEQWRSNSAPEPPRPPTAAVSPTSPPTRVPTPQSVVPVDDWLSAWRSGRLGPAGIRQPPPRRTGEPHRNAGPG
jgi:hypothetical protein